MYSKIRKIDKYLITKVIDGDKDAQKHFVDLGGKYVYGALNLYRGLNQPEISDLFQTVFLKLFEDDMRRIKLWKGDSEFSTYLYRMVINLVKDYFGSAYYRRSKFQGQNDYDSEGFIENNPGIANGPQPESVIQSITLMHMISGLRDIEKTIIHYYYFQGYKEREIAEMMKYPLNTISSIKNRALKKLKISWQAN